MTEEARVEFALRALCRGREGNGFLSETFPAGIKHFFHRIDSKHTDLIRRFFLLPLDGYRDLALFSLGRFLPWLLHLRSAQSAYARGARDRVRVRVYGSVCA